MQYQEKIDNIEAICLFPKDFAASRKFYEEVFGFQPKRIQKDGVDPTVQNPNFIEYQFHGATFALWSRDAVRDIMGENNLNEPSSAHNFMTAVRLHNLEDVDLIYEEFVKRGVKCLSKPTTYHFGSRAAYYQDIEGNIWEFYAWCNGKDGPSLV